MSDVRRPPRSFFDTLKQVGPGIIISGTIVGSGELIAATTLGARVGYALLWLILVSCLIKVVVQQQLGRHTIVSGDTPFQALDRVPGPRLRASWVVWAWMIMFVGVTFQVGGILGGLGQVFHLALPGVPVDFWVVAVAVGTLALLWSGTYRSIEGVSMALVASFTFTTVLCTILLAWTPYSMSWGDAADGFKFQLPAGGLAVAFAAFGITGVGATELIYYPYWCLEKGYARFVGRREGSAEWLARARGWVKVMHADTLLAMILYTLSTTAFYLLGAAVLHGLGQVPAGYEMVATLSGMYTATLGPWAFYFFLLGAFFVLYSTAFSATAANARVVVDFFGLVGRMELEGERRARWQRATLAGLLFLHCFWYFTVGEPVFLVILGGTAQACMLPIIGFSTIYLRYRYRERALEPGLFSDLLLWVCSTLMLAFAVYVTWSTLRSV